MLDVFLGREGALTFLKGGTSYLDFAEVGFGGAGNVGEGLSHLGAKSCFIGKAGNDVWGRLYEKDLHDKGVNTRLFIEENDSTGLTLVSLSEKGERSFFVFRGANDMLSQYDIEKATSLIEKSRYMYFSGYSLVNEPAQSAILLAARVAKERGARVLFDPGAHNLIRSERHLFAKALDLCDVFLPNLDEASEITSTTNKDDIISALKNKAPLTAMKCGRDGCILVSKKRVVRVPSFNVKCVDSTGAGDAFAAGLIYGMVKNLPLLSTGRLANWLAAKVATKVGARSFPSRTEIRSFLKELRNKRK